ncbi:MAG: metallophosphoesterase, partial [Deltaproteobacteria bacterium]
MKAIFISDAHLINGWVKNFVLIEQFFDELQATKDKAIDRLYILGDFFDFWFSKGNDIFPEYLPIVKKIVDLHQSGTTVNIVEGNHEFFMRDFFKRFEIDVTETFFDFYADGKRFFLSHGDDLYEGGRFDQLLKMFLKSEI